MPTHGPRPNVAAAAATAEHSELHTCCCSSHSHGHHEDTGCASLPQPAPACSVNAGQCLLHSRTAGCGYARGAHCCGVRRRRLLTALAAVAVLLVTATQLFHSHMRTSRHHTSSSGDVSASATALRLWWYVWTEEVAVATAGQAGLSAVVQDGRDGRSTHTAHPATHDISASIGSTLSSTSVARTAATAAEVATKKDESMGSHGISISNQNLISSFLDSRAMAIAAAEHAATVTASSAPRSDQVASVGDSSTASTAAAAATAGTLQAAAAAAAAKAGTMPTPAAAAKAGTMQAAAAGAGRTAPLQSRDNNAVQLGVPVQQQQQPLSTSKPGSVTSKQQQQQQQQQQPPTVTATRRHFPVPVQHPTQRSHNTTVIGVVFYGRRSRVRILNCYLERNLVSAGGLLREVVFVLSSADPRDSTYLERLLRAHPGEYRKVIPKRLDIGYTGHYAWMDPRETYVKIDDDVVFIQDGAVDAMLTGLTTSKFHMVSANVINHQPLEWAHSVRGAHYNFTRDGSQQQRQQQQQATAGSAAASASAGAAATAAPGAAVPTAEGRSTVKIPAAAVKGLAAVAKKKSDASARAAAAAAAAAAARRAATAAAAGFPAGKVATHQHTADSTSSRRMLATAAAASDHGSVGSAGAGTPAAASSVTLRTANSSSKQGSGRPKAWHMVPGSRFDDNGWDIWDSWERAANVHYSFLFNFRHDRLQLYNFPGGAPFFDFNQYYGYTRWRINMVIFRGRDVDVHKHNMSSTVGTYPGDDEDFLTRILPQQLNKHSAAVPHALAVHFSFYKQREGLEKNTDLLEQYADLATSMCGPLLEPKS